jgi:hypothetical protein
VIRTFHLRRVAAGKPKKLALVACMRKRLTILDVMVRTARPWTTDPTVAALVPARLSRQLLTPEPGCGRVRCGRGRSSRSSAERPSASAHAGQSARGGTGPAPRDG